MISQLNPTSPVLLELAERIRTIEPCGATRLIGIDGRCGAGKSTLARSLADALGAAQIIPLDDFPCRLGEHPFHPSGTQTHINWERAKREAIEPLLRGEGASYRRTPWWMSQTGEPEPEVHIRPGITTIVEGTTALRRQLRDLYDLRIWVDLPPGEGLERAIDRDSAHAIRDIFETVYFAHDTRYIERHRPDLAADLTLASGPTRHIDLPKLLPASP